MAGSIYLFVFGVLISSHVIGSCRGDFSLANGSDKAPAADKWNPDATSLADGAEKLRNCVIQCCKEKFAMASAVNLVMRNIPVNFNEWNDRPRGCVEMQLEINEIKTDTKGKETIVSRWNIEIDADNKTDKQKAHYGYTVYATVNGRKIPKFTGHVWLPRNPSNSRPWLGENKGQLTHFSDQMKGNVANIVFKLNGKMYNQFYVKKGDSSYDKEEDAVTQLLDHPVDGTYVDTV